MSTFSKDTSHTGLCNKKKDLTSVRPFYCLVPIGRAAPSRTTLTDYFSSLKNTAPRGGTCTFRLCARFCQGTS